MTTSTPPPLAPWLSALVPFERALVEVAPGLRMHLMTAGPSTGRPVLLMHGNPTWGFLYRKVALRLLELNPNLRLLMPDMIGLGWSDRPPGGAADHTLEHHGRWLGALVDQLDLRGVILVGQDWGGPWVLRPFADDARRDRVAGIVLMNTIVGPPGEGFKPTLFHRFSRWPGVSDFAFRVLGFPQARLDLAQADRSSISGDVARAYRAPLRGWSRNAAPLALARMVPDRMDHPSVEGLTRCQALVESFEGPAALVWGERDPILGRLLRRTARALPQAEITTTQAGHFLQEEVPDEIAQAVASVARQANA